MSASLHRLADLRSSILSGLRGDPIGFLAVGGSVLVALAGAQAFGFRINTSASMPVRLWHVAPLSAAPRRGEVVTACPPDTAGTREAAARGYLPAGSCPGRHGVRQAWDAAAGAVQSLHGRHRHRLLGRHECPVRPVTRHGRRHPAEPGCSVGFGALSRDALRPRQRRSASRRHGASVRTGCGRATRPSGLRSRRRHPSCRKLPPRPLGHGWHWRCRSPIRNRPRLSARDGTG